MNEFSQICQQHESMRQVLGDYITENAYDVDESLGRVPDALSKLTGPTYSLGDIIRLNIITKRRLCFKKYINTLFVICFSDPAGQAAARPLALSKTVT